MSAIDRAATERDLLHRVAMLLSADRTVRDLLAQFAALLSQLAGAVCVEIALLHDGEPRLELAFRDGVPEELRTRGAARDDAIAKAIRSGRPATESMRDGRVVVPIVGGGGVLGALRVERAKAFDERDVTVLQSCLVYLGARIHDEVRRREHERLTEIASTDALTGLANRRIFDEMLQREYNRGGRASSWLGLLLLDVDFFKVYNDTYGHVAGDACLQNIARAVASCVKRPADIACRYGGEEFAILLPDTDASHAASVAEAICQAVRELAVAHEGSSLGYASVSVGCAAERPEPGGDPQRLVERADAQLYRAKELGRNRVAADGYASDAPAAERRAQHRHNLPVARTQFFGRESDLEAMARIFDDAALLTVAGPGGVGKTRLSLEYARRYASRFLDGAWFVDLAPLSSGMFIAGTVLETLGVREEPGRDVERTLIEHLRARSMLLVLDNCEHVMERAAALASRLLVECESLRVVATSREILDVAGERVYRVPPFCEADGVSLFASRARAADLNFALDDASREAVGRICRQLDGIPLAIELAAARVRTIPIAELEERLSDRFRLLTGGSRTARPRQQTLYNLIDWSYNLLAESERVLLRRLAVFAGAFSLESATAICADDAIAAFDVTDALARLIDKSLVQFDPGTGRYSFLESTKQFALERLRDSGELETLQLRHAQQLRSMSFAASKQFGQGAGDRARANIVADYADYRAAMQWALVEENAVAMGAGIASSLGWYWTERGQWREGRYWLELALSRDPGEIGWETTAEARLGLAVAQYVRGEFPSMAEAARSAGEAYSLLGDRTGEASALNLLAIEAQFAGRLQEAHDLWQRVLEAANDVQNVRMEAVTLGNLAELLADWKGDYAGSEALYDRASRIHRDLANSFPLAVTLGDWSTTAAYQGEYERAEALAADALGIFRKIGEEMRIIEQLIRIGHYRVWAGRPERAREALRESIDPLRSSLNPLYVARATEAYAAYAIAMGDARAGAMLLGFAANWRRDRGLLRPAPVNARCEAAVETARRIAGAASFDAAWEEGGRADVQTILEVAAGTLV